MEENIIKTIFLVSRKASYGDGEEYLEPIRAFELERQAIEYTKHLNAKIEVLNEWGTVYYTYENLVLHNAKSDIEYLLKE